MPLCPLCDAELRQEAQQGHKTLSYAPFVPPVRVNWHKRGIIPNLRQLPIVHAHRLVSQPVSRNPGLINRTPD
jgi:hypothetical protein